MKKLLLLTLALLMGILIVSCMGSTKTQAPEPFDSPLPATDQPTFVSPLGESTERVPRFPGKIAFHSDRSGSLQIHVVHGDTGKVECLTDSPSQAFEPSWSPDCQSLVFASGRGGRDDFELYMIRVNGSDQTQVFENPTVDDWSPAWSPRNDLIAYQTNKGGSLNVCLAEVDGKSKGCLEKGAYNNALPSWSPDGDKILFVSDRDGDWEIYVTEMYTSSTPIQLTHNTYEDMHPQFSPDGRSIAFASKRQGNFDIFILKADGSDEVQLTTDSGDDIIPRWVGNDRIVFTSVRTLDWDLYLMSRDGKNISQLTHERGLDKWPAWCPSD